MTAKKILVGDYIEFYGDRFQIHKARWPGADGELKLYALRSEYKCADRRPLDLEELKAAARDALNEPWAFPDDNPIAQYAAVANPLNVLALIERLEKAEAAISKQAAAAARGMDAAKEHGSAMLQQAKALHGQANPDALASERQANAMLTEENERLQRELDEARMMFLRLPLWAKVHLTTESVHHDCHKCFRELQRTGRATLLNRMILCPTCGNKRCPKASDHELACTGSNEPGQPGSVY